MSNRIDIDVEGFEELRAKLKRLPDKVKGREIEKIMRRVAKPALAAARQEAPEGKTGALKKSLRISRIRFRDAALAGVKVAPNRKKAYYAHFVEYGRKITGKGKTRANPFVGRARTITVPGAREKARVQLARYVQKSIDRLGDG